MLRHGDIKRCPVVIGIRSGQIILTDPVGKNALTIWRDWNEAFRPLGYQSLKSMEIMNAGIRSSCGP